MISPKFKWIAHVSRTEFGRRACTLGLAVLAVVLFGCQGRVSKESADKSKQTYVMDVVVSQVPFWTESRQTWDSLGRTFKVRTTFGGPENADSQKQINELKTFISQHVSGIVITPTDSAALTPTINEAVEAGIPVVTYLVDAPASKRMMYITSALENSSKYLGDYAIRNHQAAGKAIILIGTAGSEEQERRASGFKEAVSKYPRIKLVDVIEDKFDASAGALSLKAALQRHGKVQYIFGCNSRSAAVAKLALQELGYAPGDVVVTGWDYDDDVLSAIDTGWVFASAAQQSNFMSQMAFNVLYAEANNYLYPPSLNLKQYGVSPVPTEVDIPITLITKGNAAAYFKRK
ncbi:MAG: substrate-binding domain-containing protein [Acidobacteriia bacterium]|nr:substrate-binding domain-containing protein [Terriglobia bacterium]